jgi:hypothetical protein
MNHEDTKTRRAKKLLCALRVFVVQINSMHGLKTRATLLAAFLVCSIGASAVGTSHWTHTNEADFKAGTFHNVVATNLGDLKLSRAVKTLLGQDAHISSVYALVEAADGTIYAGTGPSGIVLSVKNQKVETVATLGENMIVSSLLIDQKGRLLIGTSGEKGQIFRINAAGEKPKEIFSTDGCQYIWSLVQTADGMIYAATGPQGQLFQLKPDDTHELVFESDENNLLTVIDGGKDLLYVGTDPNGLVYRVNRKTKESFVMFDAAESEISALALDGKGNLYAATAEASETPEGQEAETPGAAEKSGRPEASDTGGVPIPSSPPANPEPPKVPPPNPGEPPPIPKKENPAPKQHDGRQAALPRQLALLPLPLAGESWGEGSAGSRTGHRIHRTLTLPSPGVPGEGKLSAPVVKLATEGATTNDQDEPGSPSPTPPGGQPNPGMPSTGAAQPGAMPKLPVTKGEAKPGAQGNAIYKIDKDGFVTEIFRQPVVVYSLIENNGVLLAGTGSEGMIYQINPEAEETVVLAKVDPKEVLSMLATRSGEIYLGLANVGDIGVMSSGYATDGTFTSAVLDAQQISRFGKIHLLGTLPAETKLTVATRSGNVKETSDTGWSKWSDEIPAAEYVQSASQAARFFQYRLTFTGNAGKTTPIVDEVDVAYEVPNMAPQIKSIKITPAGKADTTVTPGASDDTTAGATPKTVPQRVQTITWEASDPNTDPLRYSIYFRHASHEQWILLKDNLTDATYDWDTRSVADGRYEVRIVASDVLANARGSGRTAERISDPIVVDNTAPVVGDLKVSAKGNSAVVDARVVDRMTTVAKLEYAVDSNDDWQMVLPSDKIADSPEEAYSFTIPSLASGSHQITLRASDSHGNQAFESVPVTIEAPTAKK